MRNPFDQYAQPENRLTHALACTLDADRPLLRPFLRWAGVPDVPRLADLRITQQQVPGEAFSGDAPDENGARGLPDACIFTDGGWALLVEAKVQAPVSLDQLRRHIVTARRYGFEKPFLLLLSVDPPPRTMPARAAHRYWREVYAWFRNRSGSSTWARTFTDYMETFESRMIGEDYEIRGTLTMFDGLRFDADDPYTYREARRLLRLLGDELQTRKDLQTLGVDPKGKRRPAIMGRSGTSVWDFIPLKRARGATSFTAYPHLAFSIGQSGPSAGITVPHGIRGGFKIRLEKAGEEGFFDLLLDVERRTRPVIRRSKKSKVMLYATQRHFPQRTKSEVDARMDVDLRTLRRGQRNATKYQPQWARSIYEVMTQKRSNIQFGLTMHFSYDCPIVRSPKAIDLFAESWRAMSPFLAFTVGT